MGAGHLGRIQFLHGCDHLRVGEHLDGVRFIAENEMYREYPRFRLGRRGVRGSDKNKVDIAGLHLLQGLRFGAELGAGVLNDRERAFAQLHQFFIEHLSTGAVAAVLWLVISKGKLAVLSERRRRRRYNTYSE